MGMKREDFIFKWLGLRWLRLVGLQDLLACRFLLLFLASLVLAAMPPNAQAFPYYYPYKPLFEFDIFYNANLEIDPGATFPILAPVFSNEGIWSGNANPTYSSTVEAAGQITTSGIDPFLTSYTDAGTPTSNFSVPGQPIANVPSIIFQGFGTNNLEAMLDLPPSSVAAPQPIAYAQTNQIYKYNQASLVISNWSNGTRAIPATGNNFVIYLQDLNPVGFLYYPPTTGHFNQLTNDFYVVTNINPVSDVSATYFTNNLYGLPGFTSSALPAQWPLYPTANCNITWKTGSGANITNWGVEYAGWSFLTNVSFYDYREVKTVQAVQIDVSLLRQWITNAYVNGGSNWNYALAYDEGIGINSIYVYNGVPITSTTLPAVRMINGIRLPNSTNVINITNNITCGLTVATPQPMYVLGNYNVQIDGDTSVTYYPGTNNMAHTYPAALMADAITILSGGWRDTYGPSTSLSARTPSSTAITAAIIEGNVPSSINAPMSSSIDGFSGGVENFLRLLENWSQETALTYNGSICVLFPSQYATNWWQETGNYYNAPKRVWQIDTNFEYGISLPPMTPLLIDSNIAPSIVSQPSNEVSVVTGSTNIVVTASGIPAPNFQWSFDGTNILAATNAVLTLDDLQLTNAGKYAVQVTNVFGSVTSSNATLTIYASAVPAVGSSLFSAANGFQFQISGVPGYSYAIQSSPDLVNWQTVYTNTSPFSYLDTNSLNEAQQYYRVVYWP
jgi:hypothetical protein